MLKAPEVKDMHMAELMVHIFNSADEEMSTGEERHVRGFMESKAAKVGEWLHEFFLPSGVVRDSSRDHCFHVVCGQVSHIVSFGWGKGSEGLINLREVGQEALPYSSLLGHD